MLSTEQLEINLPDVYFKSQFYFNLFFNATDSFYL